ncbi:hypothetical protein SDC9_110102 [bioreactor metagenome]|uniref:Uncharacterized protein n=1 Tax=bioreactor metagenome TaxID=1076179 RepID=A0A645BD14_9ZZZZ
MQLGDSHAFCAFFEGDIAGRSGYFGTAGLRRRLGHNAQRGIDRKQCKRVCFASLLDAVGFLESLDGVACFQGVFAGGRAGIVAQVNQAAVELHHGVAYIALLHGEAGDRREQLEVDELAARVARPFLIDQLLDLGGGYTGRPQAVLLLKGLHGRQRARGENAVDSAFVVSKLSQSLLERAHLVTV